MSAKEVYLRTRKLPDLWWNAYVCRPIAALLVAAIHGTRVTPNQITLASLLVAMLAALLLLALPGHAGLVTAVIVFELSYVLDCADGMLARFRGTASAVGHLLDFLMDEIKAFAWLAAAAARLFREHGDPRFLLLGLFGLVALASGIALTTFVRRPEVAGAAQPASASTAPSGSATTPSALRRLLALPIAGAKFLIHYPSYVWLAAALNHLEAFLYPYVAVNALYAVAAFLGVARRFGRAA